VINIARRYHATVARVHHASCRTISVENPRGGLWTGPYVKVCAEQVAELEQWAVDQVGEPLRRCRACHPVRNAIPSGQPDRTGSGASGDRGPQRGPRADGRQGGSRGVGR
jgi:hypothetical protein